jgi:glycerate-2-kinase
MNNDRRSQASDIFLSVIKGVDPYKLVEGRMEELLSTIRRHKYRRVLLAGFGKAAYSMTRAVSDLAGEVLTAGIAVTKYGHIGEAALTGKVRLFEAAHPVPDHKGVQATEEVIRMLGREKDEGTLLLCLISGGGSALLVAPFGDVVLAELALAFAREIKGIKGITFLSAGTDGADGPTDAAGAVVDGEAIPRAEAMGLEAEPYLNNNDSYSFFKKTGELLITGPTGTNVMDIQIVLIG